MKIKQITASLAASVLLLSALSAVSLPSCSDAGQTTPSSETQSRETTAPVTEQQEQAFVYDYTAAQAYESAPFRILNAEDVYSMHAQIDRESTTGESLNDAMYTRCRTFEEKTGAKLEETGKHVDTELAQFAKKSVMAGEDAYDIIFIPARDLYTFASENALYNLHEISELNLSSPWWISSYNDDITISDNLFVAASYAQLMIIDSIWCLYFNETIMKNLDLELPYSMVRDGTWTLDRLDEYLKASASLNGDSSFSAKGEGNCIYGIATGGQCFPLFYGCGERIIQNQDGVLTLDAGNERFFQVADALASMMSTSDGHFFHTVPGAVDGEPGSYISVFENQRSLFLMAEISKTNRMRDKDYSFGIVPYPKFDAEQDAYYVTPFYGTPCMSIPVTVQDPKRSAVLADALAYLSYDVVLPVFRETTLEQKNLRNEDSVEMLNIIMDSVVPDLTNVFADACNTFKEALNTQIKKQNGAIASTFEKHQKRMQKAIDAYNQ